MIRLKILPVNRNEKVLDIGCYDGWFVKILRKKGIEAYGIDINEDIVKRSNCPYVILGDARNIPFPNEFFDKIFACEVLEHIEEDELVIKEICRVLRKGGKVLISVPRKTLFNFWDPAYVRWKILKKDRHYHYSIKELITKLKRYGFKIERIEVYWKLRWLFFRWFYLINKYLFKSKLEKLCKKIEKTLKPWEEKGIFDLNIVASKY